jgi:hypothetical protein
MNGSGRVAAGLNAVLATVDRGADLAERLCAACVDLLGVDGASICFVHGGAVGGSLSSSDVMSRELDELQFTCGEGPGVDSARDGNTVLVADLQDGTDDRWPAFTAAGLQLGVRAIFALPVSVAHVQIGLLDLYRNRPGDLDAPSLAGGLLAAELAVLPLLDLMGTDLNAAVATPGATAYRELTVLTRVEVHQATGMLIAQLDIGPAEALVRLRAYAFAHDLPVNQVALDIVERRLRLEGDDSWRAHEKDGSP